MASKSPNEQIDEWVLPASIPFSTLKGRDLEECVYWLLDAMGAKDLEWRTGGSGGGAADGGRDLEAVFYSPSLDGEMEAQKWWIECKGRTATVEPDEVKSAVNNAMAIEGLDYLVIATNTQFSNPTRDWVKRWQAKNSKPKVKLWDQAQLERYLSRHPDVVLRLFSEALSVGGRLKALESRFWNKLEFVTPKTLTDIWAARHDLEFEDQELFALTVNEFAGGNITQRPWGAILEPDSVAQVFGFGIQNLPYLFARSVSVGVSQLVISRAFAYLIVILLESYEPEIVYHLILLALNRGEQKPLFPEEMREILLAPIIYQLQAEFQDVCSSDCKRMMASDRAALVEGKDETEDYWMRFEPEGVEEVTERRLLRIEARDEPCIVGFNVDRDNGCPLFRIQPKMKNGEELLETIKRVAEFRRRQAAEVRSKKQSAGVAQPAHTR